jgi:hypothetical protein
VAVAIGLGYLLGRTHKLKWALVLGTAAATGSLKGMPAQVLERGAKALQSTPELAKMADSAQRLLEAGRTAAMSAMSSRVESMGDVLEGRVQRVAGGDIAGSDTDDDDERGASDEYEDQDKDQDEDQDEDQDQDDEEQDEYDEEQEPEEPNDDEPEDEAEESEEGDRAVSSPRQKGTGRQGRPAVVRKTGR